jgi:hypothetical protein
MLSDLHGLRDTSEKHVKTVIELFIIGHPLTILTFKMLISINTLSTASRITSKI